MSNEIYQSLFVLELANKHWGSTDRGKRIIDAYAEVIQRNGVRASVKLQFRHVESFIHKDYRALKTSRYITKTIATQMSDEANRELAERVREHGLVPMATPYDERSVGLCEELGIEIIKIASSDINDWVLINAIAKTCKPVIVSTGGASVEDIRACVQYFDEKEIVNDILRRRSIEQIVNSRGAF